MEPSSGRTKSAARRSLARVMSASNSKERERATRPPPEVRNLVVASDVEGLIVDFVRNNDGNMFYWGRRGPSVHLGYETPKNVPLQYAHTEIVVPKGDDTIGSYFMANGFAEGYFGIQVNSPRERRVLFSVWSPFSTDNPRTSRGSAGEVPGFRPRGQDRRVRE